MLKPIAKSTNIALDASSNQTNKIAVNRKTAKVIAGFPGVGKSHFSREHERRLRVIDADSTNFSKLADKVTPNPAWPKNYVEHIRENMSKVDIIFVSTHKDTRAALAENKILYTLVYPEKNLKPEYMQRYRDRKSPEFLIDILDKNWSNFVSECESQGGCKHLKLKAGEYIDSMAEKLLAKEEEAT